MYTSHFGLHAKPFGATPNPQLVYDNAVYREAYATLLYGVLERQGFIVLTGEVGTGKTTLLRRLMDELADRARFVLFYNTTLTFDETVEFMCAELELSVNGLSRVQRLQALNDVLIAETRAGGNVVLLIDEAQNLGADVLENLRLISNLETSTDKLLQIVLVGQPELEVRLADPALRPVAQRIAVRFRLEALARHEVPAYIDYRLRQCGGSSRDLFTAGAIRRVAAYSRGIPRLINILCDGALLGTYGAGMRRVTRGMVDEVAAYLRLPKAGERRRASTAERGGLWRRGGWATTGRAARWVAAGLLMVAMAASMAVLPRSSFTAIRGEHRAEPPPGTAVGPLAAAPAASPATPAPRPVPDAVTPPGPTGPLERSSPGQAAPELPAVERDDDDQRIVVPAGMNVAGMVSRRYGRHHVLGLDLVKDLNPHVADLDHVAAGEHLWMPPLTPHTLARRQPDGSYQLIVASLPTADAADRLAERLRHTGHRARVAKRDITAEVQVHRVLVEGLEGVDAVDQAWRAARKLGGAPARGERGR